MEKNRRVCRCEFDERLLWLCNRSQASNEGSEMAVECRNLLVRCHGGTAALVGVRLKARLLCKDRAETTHEVDVLDAVENAVKKHDRISVDERSSQVEEARAGVAKEMSTCRGRFWKRLVRQRCRVCWTVIRSKGVELLRMSACGVWMRIKKGKVRQ